MMPEHEWAFPARCIHVVDGDTLHIEVDVGFRMRWEGRLRLAGIDTPEMRGDERTQGEISRAFVVNWLMDLDEEWPLMVLIERLPDSFGRAIGAVWRRSDGASLTLDLLCADLAEVYE